VDIRALATTANEMVANGKGLLAIDESTGTCNKRFAQWGIPQNAEPRRQYRELIINTPGLAESISVAILYDETIRQRKDDGTPFAEALADLGIIGAARPPARFGIGECAERRLTPRQHCLRASLGDRQCATPRHSAASGGCACRAPGTVRANFRQSSCGCSFHPVRRQRRPR
jgi:hypothetical protein